MKVLYTLTLISVMDAASAFMPTNTLHAVYSTELRSSENDDMSTSLPFLSRPKLLDGSLPGDVGFE